jgi:hypothetical protein
VEAGVAQGVGKRVRGNSEAVDGADEVSAVMAAGLVVLEAVLPLFG